MYMFMKNANELLSIDTCIHMAKIIIILHLLRDTLLIGNYDSLPFPPNTQRDEYRYIWRKDPLPFKLPVAIFPRILWMLEDFLF